METFNELDSCAFTVATAADKYDIIARLDSKVEVAQDINFEDRVEQADNVRGSTLGGGDVRDEGEDIASLDGREDGGDSGGRQPGRSQTRRRGQ